MKKNEDFRKMIAEYKVYRWHIIRKLINPGLNDDIKGKVDVTVIPAKSSFPVYDIEQQIQSIYDLPDDGLGFWEDREELQLEGWATEQALLEVLFTRNLIEDAARGKTAPEDRQIVEDMVLLQLVKESKNYLMMWEKAAKDTDLPDLSGLVKMEDVYWIDYTHQARKLTKDIYNRVLVVMRERAYAEKQ